MVSLKRPAAELWAGVEKKRKGHAFQQNEDRVQLLFGLMNARETVRIRREKGLEGPPLYEGLDVPFAEYFKRHSCPNVHRWHDRTTMGLHKLCAAEARWRLCETEEERQRLKRLLVLNFSVWRTLGICVPFASELGFLQDWGDREKARIRAVVSRAFRENRAAELFSDAYNSPNRIRKSLQREDEAYLERVLYNSGPKAVPDKEPHPTYESLVGKFRVLDLLWAAAPAVCLAAADLGVDGLTRMAPVGEVLKEVPFFGSGTNDKRLPGFFAKEVLQDLVDTPVFPGGRRKVADRRSFCPVGPGAVEGLRLVYGQMDIAPGEITPMMLALLEKADKYWEGDPDELELHDIQFMLCELQKFLKYLHGARSNGLRCYAGFRRCLLPTSAEVVQQRVEEMLVLRLLQALETPRRVARELSAFLGLGLSFRDLEDHSIRSGDLVVLKNEARHNLFLDDNGELRSGTESKKKGALEPTLFRIQTEVSRAPLRFGQVFFLRAPNGAHLGPLKDRFAAPMKGERFAKGKQLTACPIRKHQDRDREVELGETLLLQSESARPGTSLRCRLERDPVAQQREQRLETLVHQAMQNMHLEPESGTLRNYAQVRGRCIGTLRPTKRLRCKTRP